MSTHGFVCAGRNGNCAHWLCIQCCRVHGNRATCPEHPHATVVPAQGLWGDTRFEPKAACAPPTNVLSLSTPTILDSVSVRFAGNRGLRLTAKPASKAIVLKLGLKGVRGHRYAVLWPGHKDAWMFPRPVQQRVARADNPAVIVSAQCWSAWTQDATHELAPKLLMGLNPNFVQLIMSSPCARARWWFLMPRTAPPLMTPPEAASMPGVTNRALSLGPNCDAPLRPFSPCYTASASNLKCAWCGSRKTNKSEWLRDCAPDVAMFISGAVP